MHIMAKRSILNLNNRESARRTQGRGRERVLGGCWLRNYSLRFHSVGVTGAGRLLFFHGIQVILLRWPDRVPSDLVSIGIAFLEAIPGHPHLTSVRSLAAHRPLGHVGQNPAVLVVAHRAAHKHRSPLLWGPSRITGSIPFEVRCDHVTCSNQ